MGTYRTRDLANPVQRIRTKSFLWSDLWLLPVADKGNSLWCGLGIETKFNVSQLRNIANLLKRLSEIDVAYTIVTWIFDYDRIFAFWIDSVSLKNIYFTVLIIKALFCDKLISTNFADDAHMIRLFYLSSISFIGQQLLRLRQMTCVELGELCGSEIPLLHSGKIDKMPCAVFKVALPGVAVDSQNAGGDSQNAHKVTIG